MFIIIIIIIIVAGLTFFFGAVEVVSGSEGMFVLGY